MTWYHGGRAGLAPGDALTSPASRGGESRSVGYLGGLIAEYVEPPWSDWLVEYLAAVHDPGRLYVTPEIEVARGYAGEHGGSVYEVAPEGDPVPSGEQEFSCEAASVVRVVEEKVPPFSPAVRLERLLALAGMVGATMRPEPTARLLFDALADEAGIRDRGEPHGVDHARRVLDNGLRIGGSEGADLYVVAAFAVLHDACRESDGPDPEHGLGAVELAGRLFADGLLPLDTAQAVVLSYALLRHDEGQTTTDATVGACWDADRLDLPRCGIDVDPRLLSTTAARELLAAAPT